MSEIIGRQIELGLAVESSRGTAQTSAEKWVKKITANIVQRAEKKIDESTRGILEDTLGARLTKKWFEGDLEGNVHADAIGYLFYNLFGADTDSSLGSGAYQHIFSLSQSITHASLSLFAKDGGNNQEVFDTGMVTSLELKAVVDDYVKFTASFLAAEATANADTPSYDTEYDFIGKDIVVKFANTEAGLSGASASKLKDLSIKFDVGGIADFVVGSYSPDDIYNAKMSIEGSFTLNYDDDTFKDLYIANSYKYMQISIIDTSSNLGGGANATVQILLNRVGITDWNREGGADDLVTQSVSFKAFYNATDSEMATVTLKNKTAEYDVAPTA